MNRDRFFIAILVLLVVAAFAFVIWTEVKHPCIAWTHKPCQHTECALRSPMYADSHGQIHMGTCLGWKTIDDQCLSCAERK